MTGYISNLAGASAAAMAMTMVSCGAAAAATGAPNVVDKKYSDASAELSKAGYTAVVSARVGDDAQQSDCMVTYQQAETMPKVGTKKYQVDESKNVLVSLSCYAGTAAQGEPGYSTGDPNARQFQQNNTAAAGQR